MVALSMDVLLWQSWLCPSTLPPVYSQSLSHILQVLAGPMMQLLESELSRNKALMNELTEKKEQLKRLLSTGSDENGDLVW